MPEPVSTIVALHNLVSRLMESVQDRKLATEMRDIQRLVVAMQSEHFALQEKSLQLQTERAKLEQRLIAVEPLVANAEKKGAEDAKRIEELSEEVRRLSANKVFHKMKYGCLQFDGDENLYCPACFIVRGIKIPTSRKMGGARHCSACRQEIPAT